MAIRHRLTPAPLVWPAARGVRGRVRDHALTEDSERDIATGEQPGRLSATGRQNADDNAGVREDGVAAVFSSKLHRASKKAQIGLATSSALMQETIIQDAAGKPIPASLSPIKN
jgi:hypothetical protein